MTYVLLYIAGAIFTFVFMSLLLMFCSRPSLSRLEFVYIGLGSCVWPIMILILLLGLLGVILSKITDIFGDRLLW